MKDRAGLINFIIQQHGFESYLEIGLLNGRTFKRVRAKRKESVDCNPKCRATYNMTSDQFFTAYGDMSKTYDVVLVDGSHLAEDAGNDAIFSLHLLNPKYIIMHDCNPLRYENQTRQRASDCIDWNGDVWLAWIALRQVILRTPMFVVDIDHGCGIIYNKKEVQPAFAIEGEVTWESFKRNREKWLNLRSVEYFKNFVMERAKPLMAKNS